MVFPSVLVCRNLPGCTTAGDCCTQPLSGSEVRTRMASRKQGTFSVSCQPLQRSLEPFGTPEPFSLCSKRQQGEVFIAAAQTLADGPSTWKKTCFSLVHGCSIRGCAESSATGPAAFRKHPGFAPVLFEGLEGPSSGHHGDGRGFGDLRHRYQRLQDILKSPNAAKVLVMGRRKEQVSEQVRRPISAGRGCLRSPWHHQHMASPGWLQRHVPVPQEGCQAPTKAPLSPVFLGARLCYSRRARGGCRRAAFLHGAASLARGCGGWRSTKPQCPPCPGCSSGCGTAGCFPPALTRWQSFANIFLGQEGLSHRLRFLLLSVRLSPSCHLSAKLQVCDKMLPCTHAHVPPQLPMIS